MAFQEYQQSEQKDSEQARFKNIEIIPVDNSAASFANWPHQLENINLLQVHNNFLNDCNSKYFNLISDLKEITIWMINSTAVGGGVAEMLPMLIPMFSKISIKIKWIVISPSKNEYEEQFFNLTKQMHNNIHGVFNEKTMEKLTDKHRNILEQVCGDAAKEFIPLISKNDIIVIHDPQPLAMIKFIKAKLGNQNLVFWRSHIGVDNDNQVTKDTWQFLSPYIKIADHIIFSVRNYIPKFVIENQQSYSVIPPAICPFNPKNIQLSHAQLNNILIKSGIIHSADQQKWEFKAKRVCAKTGKLVECSTIDNTNYELLFNPLICEISRWDALKGWIQLIEAFVHIKQQKEITSKNNILRDMILVLAGPDPSAIQDDPEGIKVFNDLCQYYQSLSESLSEIQEQIYIISLPMENTQQNAYIVNALQRLSSIIIQNSLMEGFGLTVTEAMYKGTPMVAGNVGGIKIQIEHMKNGIMIQDPSDYKSVADAIQLMVKDGEQQMIKYSIAGKKSVMDKFLIWSHCRNYLDAFGRFGKKKVHSINAEEKEEDNFFGSNGALLVYFAVTVLAAYYFLVYSNQ